MMSSDHDPAKLLLPYLLRADELQKQEPVVAYYCRLYAMEKGLKISAHERTKTCNGILASVMKRLEKDKKSLNLSSEDNLYIEGFASRVFARADKQDRSGRADRNTAKTFYAASIFFEILSQFGPLQPDLAQQQKYAVWKAADISKALKEGRKPIPGPPAGDDEFTDQDSTTNDEYDLTKGESPAPSTQQELPTSALPRTVSSSHDLPDGATYLFSNTKHDFVYDQSAPDMGSSASIPSGYHTQPYSNSSDPSLYSHHLQPAKDPAAMSYPNFQSYPSFSESSFPSVPSHPPYGENPYAQYSATSYPSHPQHVSNNVAASTSPIPVQQSHNESNYEPPPEKVSEAQKAARFAVGALAFDDVSSAVDYLRKSLSLLTNPSASH